MKIILCSVSARRRELVKKIGLPFVISDPRFDESAVTEQPIYKKRFLPARMVEKLALAKALRGSCNFHSGIAVGADTVVVLGKDIIGKPRGVREAAAILSRLNGTNHTVYTGVALLDRLTGRVLVAHEKTVVRMRHLSGDEIRVISRKHLDKAGAYAVQEKGDALVEIIKGDYYNVVGFPVGKIKEMLGFFTGRAKRVKRTTRPATQ
ncbi:MAG: septum formation protein Maf [Elusimicrobia bacterium]|nr:septum formation protein Maf [Nanoarchaeota archaeon]MBU2568284.1 septum formation protein Maf [Elusimicrobiota bacterium]